MLWMLPKYIVFNGVAVFKTPACAKDDRIVQIDEDNCKTTSYGDTILKQTFRW